MLMSSREEGMLKVEEYIEVQYKGIKKELPQTDKEILFLNILMQFRELFEDKIKFTYKNGFVDSAALSNYINNYSPEDLGLKISYYEIMLKSGNIIRVKLEFTTGYICPSISNATKEDIEMLSQIEHELIICRGITQKDIDTKSMIYYRYESEKKESIYYNYTQG